MQETETQGWFKKNIVIFLFSHQVLRVGHGVLAKVVGLAVRVLAKAPAGIMHLINYENNHFPIKFSHVALLDDLLLGPLRFGLGLGLGLGLGRGEEGAAPVAEAVAAAASAALALMKGPVKRKIETSYLTRPVRT